MKTQSGFTLISILIGLVIGILCILALMMSYRVVVKTGIEARQATSHDTQMQNGLTMAQIFLQNAGFGLEGTHHFFNGKIEFQHQTVDAILWRYQEGDSLFCEGLADIPDQKNEHRLLVLLNTEQTCDTNSNLNAFTWNTQQTLADVIAIDEVNSSQFHFHSTPQNCSPYGAGALNEETLHPLITISAKTSAQYTAQLEQNLQSPVCLINIKAV